MFRSGQLFSFLVVVVAIASLGPLLYLHQQWLVEGANYSQLITRLSTVREGVAEAHLWAEELITGDTTQDIAEVRERFSDAHIAAAEFLEFLPEKGGGVMSKVVDGTPLKEHVELLALEIVSLEEAADSRLAARAVSVAGSASDITFDSIYKRVLEKTRLIERTVVDHQQRATDRNLRNHWLTLLVWAATLAGTALTLLVLRSRQQKMEDEKRLMESRFQEAQKLESLGVLAGGIAHDFNNLLQAISGNASLLLHDTTLPEKIRDQVLEIDGGAQKASELTSQMLAYAGKGRLNEVVVLFDSMVEEIGTLVRLSVPKTVQVLYDLKAGGACLRCNQTQLQQVVMNLVINAAEASQDDPQPVEVMTYSRTFEAAELIDSVSTAEMCEPGEYVVFEVQDHGTGMSDETLERCFEPFFSTKFTGRGLGLAAVHGIVRAHQGLLKVRTELGKGTNFQVYLPRCFEDPDVRDVVTSVPTYSGIGRKVLVIDDDPMVRKIMVRMLKRIGYEVVSEESGEKGIECLTELDGKFHVVIVDMEMPGKNGLAVGKIIRERWSHLPLVLSSGYSQDLIQDGGPFDAFIQKPYTLTSMATTVNSVALDPDGQSSP